MNPAERLADLLASWQVDTNQTPYAARFSAPDKDDDGIEIWRQQASAAELVVQVERALDGMDSAGDDTSVFRQYLPEWYRGVFSANLAFLAAAGQGGMPAVEATALQALRMLSVTLNRLIAEQPMPQGDRETLATLLDEIQKFVEITTELSDRETIAICGLVRGAQRVLGRLDFGSGPEQLRAAVSELSLRLATEALRIPDDPATGKPSPVKDKLLAYAAGVATIIFTPGVSAIFTELGTEAAKYITGAQ